MRGGGRKQKEKGKREKRGKAVDNEGKYRKKEKK